MGLLIRSCNPFDLADFPVPASLRSRPWEKVARVRGTEARVARGDARGQVPGGEVPGGEGPGHAAGSQPSCGHAEPPGLGLRVPPAWPEARDRGLAGERRATSGRLGVALREASRYAPATRQARWKAGER